MKENAQEELTQEQLEMQEAKKIRQDLQNDIFLGKELKKLQSNPAFKAIIAGLFIEKGKEILWENIKHFTEQTLLGKGTPKSAEQKAEFEKQLYARLHLEGTLNRIEMDAENAEAELKNIDEAEAAEAKALEEAEAKGE